VSKTAIVVGATGLVGKALVTQLCTSELFSQVVCISRRELNASNPKVTNKIVDFDKLDDFASAFKGDFLFSCLGTTFSQAGSIEAQRKVDVDYQLKAAQLAAQNGVEHYLLVSSASANAQSKSPYLKMKGELEARVCQLPFKRITIVQPSMLLGERDKPRLGEKIGAWVLPLITSIPPLQKYRPITGSQVAAKMVYASQHQEHSFKRYRLVQLFDLS